MPGRKWAVGSRGGGVPRYTRVLLLWREGKKENIYYEIARCCLCVSFLHRFVGHTYVCAPFVVETAKRTMRAPKADQIPVSERMRSFEHT